MKSEERHDSPKRVRRLLQRERTRGFNRMRHLAIRKCQLRLNATRHELMLKALLDRLQYRYQFQKGFLSGGVMFIADFYLPKPRRIVIEVDGSTHLGKKQVTKDALRDAYFTERGLRVIRITNSEVLLLSVEDLRRLIGPKKMKLAEADDCDPATQFNRYA